MNTKTSSSNNKIFGGSSGTHSTGKKRGGKKRKVLITLCVILVVLVILYLIAVYSNIPFIKDLREMYIQTAMSTMNHQWLATYFIPSSVVDEVVEKMDQSYQDNMVPESELPPEAAKPDPAPGPTPSPKDPVTDDPDPEPWEPIGVDELLTQFPELDPDTLPSDIRDFRDLQISDIADLGIKTTAGDDVWAIDSPNNILIVSFHNSDYTGKLAIVKDPMQMKLAVNQRSGRGTNVTDFCTQEGAVLGINASGFEDPEGHGKGDVVDGVVVIDGVAEENPTSETTFQTVGFDYDGNLRMGYNLDYSELHYAVQFHPIIVLNGKLHVDGSFMSLQPRTCIGQASDRSVLLLVIEGRNVTTGLGASVETCAKILLRYDCFNAMNLDGGSSSSMTYMGEMITKSSSPMTGGRTLPNAWVVLPPSDVEDLDK